MGRASKQQAAEHHGAIVAAASRLFREQGIGATSIPEVMGAAGLTHGGFYGHFPSKEALAAAACDDGFAWLEGLFDTIAEKHPQSQKAARKALIETYLSRAHRDNPGGGCPALAWGSDVGREPPASPVRAAYASGIAGVFQRLAERFDGRARQKAIADYATLVGALLLSRATAGTPLSDEILTASAARLTHAR